MRTTSVIEISRKALESNLNFLREYIGRDVKFSSVVKGNAYGHGIEEFVPIAERAGIDHFAVFSVDEAYRVCRMKSRQTDVMIMGWVEDEALEWAINNEIEFYVFELNRLIAAINVARKLNKKARVHIEVETGMNRTGFKQKTLQSVAKLIKDNPEHISFRGLCTHFAGAESIANHVRVQKQYKRFGKICNWFKTKGLIPELHHTASSAAAMTYPKTRMDMVRVGILQYGLWPSSETFIHYIINQKEKNDPLLRLLNWKTRIMSIKNVTQGEFVSYGTSYLATENKKIAIIPTGYSHGFSRGLSNAGRVLINGERVATIGMVNMNMLIADVSMLPDVEVGDEVVLIGEQGGHTISVSSFSQLSDQLNYELLTRLPANTTRLVTS